MEVFDKKVDFEKFTNTLEALHKDFEKLLSDAYERGYQQGKLSMTGIEANGERVAYFRGADLAWQLAKDIICHAKYIQECFGQYSGTDLFDTYTGSSAVDKYNEYDYLKNYYDKDEKKEVEFKVGSEVTDSDGQIGVILSTDNHYFVLWSDGQSGYYSKVYVEDNMNLTGRSYRVQEMYDMMKDFMKSEDDNNVFEF